MSSEKQKLILIADDNADILALIQHQMERAGFRVITASDGQEAVEKAAEYDFDLAILDVRMPRMSGFEVTEHFRATLDLADLPVILLTATVQDKQVARGFKAGANDYFKKPFSPRELEVRVRAILDEPK